MILGLAEHGLVDAFRTVDGNEASDASWVARRGDKSWGRRYDTSSSLSDSH